MYRCSDGNGRKSVNIWFWKKLWALQCILDAVLDLWLGCCLPWFSYVVVFGCAVNSRVSELEDFFPAVTDAVFDRIVRIDVLGLPHRPNTPKCAQSNSLHMVYNLNHIIIGGF